MSLFEHRFHEDSSDEFGTPIQFVRPLADALGGADGREVGPVSEVTRNTGGRGGGFREGVEPSGNGRGTYYVEDEAGNRYPLAEVEI